MEEWECKHWVVVRVPDWEWGLAWQDGRPGSTVRQDPVKEVSIDKSTFPHTPFTLGCSPVIFVPRKRSPADTL